VQYVFQSRFEQVHSPLHHSTIFFFLFAKINFNLDSNKSTLICLILDNIILFICKNKFKKM
jgi:hypothetical protein